MKVSQEVSIAIIKLNSIVRMSIPCDFTVAVVLVVQGVSIVGVRRGVEEW